MQAVYWGIHAQASGVGESGSEQGRKKCNDQDALSRWAKVFYLLEALEEPFEICRRIVHLKIKCGYTYPSLPIFSSSRIVVRVLRPLYFKVKHTKVLNSFLQVHHAATSEKSQGRRRDEQVCRTQGHGAFRCKCINISKACVEPVVTGMAAGRDSAQRM